MFVRVRLQANFLVRRWGIYIPACSSHMPNGYLRTSLREPNRFVDEFLSFGTGTQFHDLMEQHDRNGWSRLSFALTSYKKMTKQSVEMNLLNDLARCLREDGMARTLDADKYSFNLDATLVQAQIKQGAPFKAKIADLIFVKNLDELPKEKDHNCTLNEMIFVLEKTNFFASSGDQASDKGTLEIQQLGFYFLVDHVVNVDGYLFHVGRTKQEDKKQEVKQFSGKYYDSVECVVDGKARFATSLNHTGLHLLNHAIRDCYGSEDSVTQMNSMAQSSGLKCEMKINKALDGGKPTLADVEHIERMCTRLIDAALPIYVADNVNTKNIITPKKAQLNYPLRNLGNVLFPSKVRVVSVGAPWAKFKASKKAAKNSDLISAEVCCGTHVTNTSQLGQLVITRLEAVGDSSFEIEAQTGARAAEVRRNDVLLQRHLQEMDAIGGHDASDQLSSPLEHHTRLHRLADISTKISEVCQAGDLSYQCQQLVVPVTSNIELQHALKRYFELELVIDSSNAANAVVIPPSETSDNRQLPAVKYLAFDSTLTVEQIVGVLKKIERLHPTLMLYNSYRGIYILYSTRAINEQSPTHLFFDMAQAEILASNKLAVLVDKKPSYRVIRCPDAPIHNQSNTSKNSNQ